MFKGSFTALITPFENGSIDENAFQELVQWQIEEGTHGLVPVGTTGESPTLSHAEHKRVVELCVEVAKGRAHIVAGSGSNSTATACTGTPCSGLRFRAGEGPPRRTWAGSSARLWRDP